jgi:hypothetical protein
MAPSSKHAEAKSHRKDKNDQNSRGQQRNAALPVQWNDDELWHQSHLQLGKLDFYAQAELFAETLKTCTWATGAAHHRYSRTPKGQFLDQIALFFAREKNLPGGSGEGRDKSESGTEQNVTAATLETDPRNRSIVIHLAKNGGPQHFGESHDEEFASVLATWYNELDVNSSSPLAQRDGMWEKMQESWFRRHRFYIDQIHEECFRHSMPSNNPERRNTPPTSLMDVVRRDHGLAMQFQEDWAHVNKLLLWLAEAGGPRKIVNDSTLRNAFVDRICFEDNERWGQLNYRLRVRELDPEMATWSFFRFFPRVINYFKLLKTCLATWNMFVWMKSLFGDWQLSFNFLPRPEIDIIPGEQMQLAVHSMQFLGEAIEAKAEKLELSFGARNFRRYIHCELQLVQHLEGVALQPETGKFLPTHGGRTVFPYIGCSKLACFFCWELTSAKGFSMRNTHGRIISGCGFPVHVRTDASDPVVDRMNEMSARMEEELQGWKGQPTNPHLVSNTVAGGSLAPEVELMGETDEGGTEDEEPVALPGILYGDGDDGVEDDPKLDLSRVDDDEFDDWSFGWIL